MKRLEGELTFIEFDTEISLDVDFCMRIGSLLGPIFQEKEHQRKEAVYAPADRLFWWNCGCTISRRDEGPTRGELVAMDLPEIASRNELLASKKISFKDLQKRGFSAKAKVTTQCLIGNQY